MAEYRPYRIINSAAQARLTRVKLIAVSSFLLLAVLINWIVTQHVARLFGYAPGSGPSLIGQHLCAVGMAGLVDALALGGAAPAAVGIMPAAGCLSLIRSRAATAAGDRDIARYFLSERLRSAWFGALGERARCRAIGGLIAPSVYLPRWLRRLARAQCGLHKAPRGATVSISASGAKGVISA